MNIRFKPEHIQLFNAASLDSNPLHLSEMHARKSAYGEPVVFGILGCLASLAQVPIPPETVVRSVQVDFKGALLLNTDYRIVAKEQQNAIKVTLLDGSATVMVLLLSFENGVSVVGGLPETGIAPQFESRRLTSEDLRPGLSFEGHYSPDLAAYNQLLQALEVDRIAWGDPLLLTLLASSYLTGMELPGESAAFTGLSADLLPLAPNGASRFEIALDSYDERFSLVESRFSLAGQQGVYARGSIRAIARPPRVCIDPTKLVPGSGRFSNKTAVVVGASRGLGAALALQLVAEGCTVVGVYAKSGDAAEEVAKASRYLPGKLIMKQGDAADVGWCAAMKDRLKEDFGCVNLLICSAAPALQNLRLEESCFPRIAAFLKEGFALVGSPLSAFLELISRSNGGVLLVSSSAVEQPPPSWPHYVALKSAAEGLFRAAAAGYPNVKFVIARPGKLRTDMTNTPIGWMDAEEPERAAGRVIQAFEMNTDPGTVCFCG